MLKYKYIHNILNNNLNYLSNNLNIWLPGWRNASSVRSGKYSHRSVLLKTEKDLSHRKGLIFAIFIQKNICSRTSDIIMTLIGT